MTHLVDSIIRIPRFKERQLENGAIERTVRVTKGDHRGKRLIFTKHSEDCYTVEGLDDNPQIIIRIERRKYEEQVRLHDSSIMLTLGVDDKWLAHYTALHGYYGSLAVGVTPEQTYARLFAPHAKRFWRIGY